MGGEGYARASIDFDSVQYTRKYYIRTTQSYYIVVYIIALHGGHRLEGFLIKIHPLPLKSYA